MKSIDFIKLPLQTIAFKGIRLKTTLNGEKAYYIVAHWLLLLGSLNTLLNGYGQYIVMMDAIHDGEGLSVYGRHLYPLFYITSLVAKIFAILFKRRQLNKLLLDLDDNMPQTKEEQQNYQLNKYYRDATKLTRICAIIAVFAINYASFSPSVVQYFKSKRIGAHFEMQYPYEPYPIYPKAKIFFPIFFFSQCWEAAINIGTINAINFMIYGIIFMIHMHYKHLAMRIITHDETRNDHNDYKHLGWCVTKHNQLDEYEPNFAFKCHRTYKWKRSMKIRKCLFSQIRFIHQLNDIFSIASLVNLCCSTSILVLFCFMGTNLASTNDLIQYLMNAFSSIVELFVMCWFSQKIRDSVSFK